MTEYWKSVGKKYCEVCKCWFADNKSSIEFHERGLRHIGNVERRLREVRKRGTVVDAEQKKYALQMAQIESAALSAFQNDIAANPKRAKEMTMAAAINNLPVYEGPSGSGAVTGVGRFGDQIDSESGESKTLVRGRERALDTISKKLAKKAKWLEAQSAEGKTYFWNRETYETLWEKPKSGFLTLEEQKLGGISGAPVIQASGFVKSNPYGKWQEVSDVPYEENMPDLQLPGNPDVLELLAPPAKEEVSFQPEEVKMKFEEKTMENISKKPGSSNSKPVMFKKRKVNDATKRNVRRREDDN